MAKAITGAVELAGAAALLGFAISTGGLAGGLLAFMQTGMGELFTGLAASGVATEVGAIAQALTNAPGVNITDRRPASNRQIVYGTQRVGGVLVFEAVTGHQYNQIIVLAGHEIHSIQAIYLDGREVFFTGSGTGWSVHNGVGFGGNADGNNHVGPDGITQYNFGGNVFVEARYGDQAFGDYMGSLTAQNGSNWGPAANGDIPSLVGCAYIYLKCTAGSAFPQRPQVSVLINGKNDILDPRTGNKGFTNNAALVLADLITDTTYGLGDSNVNTDQLIAAANICDEQVPVAALDGASESRYCCDYIFDTSSSPGDVMQTMLYGMAGRLSNIGGSWFIFPGVYTGPTLSFDDSAFTAAPSWQPRRSVRDLPNRVVGTHISAEWPYSTAGDYYQQKNVGVENTFNLMWQPTSFPYYATDSLHGYLSDQFLTQDGGRIRPLSLTLSTVLSLTQCQRIAKINLMRARAFQGSGTFEFAIMSGAYQLQPCDTFLMSSNAFGGWQNKVLEVTGTTLQVSKNNDSGGNEIRYQLNVQETDASIYTWNTAEELTIYSKPAAPTQVPYTPNPPTNLQVTSSAATAIVGQDNSVTPCIQVTWDTPQDPLAVSIAIVYRITGTTQWYSAPSVSISQNIGLIAPVIAGQTYDVMIATQRAGGVLSDWLEWGGFPVPSLTTYLGTLSSSIVPTLQVQASSGASQSIVPNGDLSLGTQGFFICEHGGSGNFSYDISNKRMVITPNEVGVGSPTFGVTPGYTYQFVFDAWSDPGVNVYFRINHSATNQQQITFGNRSGLTDLLGPFGAAINNGETLYSYPWTCPAGVYYASVSVYNWPATSGNVYVRSVQCIPYGVVAEAGADKTGSNTSNNTNNVGSVSSTAVSGTILPGGGIDFNNPGNANKGALANLNQVSTTNIVAGAVNSSVSFSQSSTIVIPANTETNVAQTSIATGGGYVKVLATVNLSANPTATAATVRLYKGTSSGPLLASCLSIAVPSPGAGSVSVTLMGVDATPSGTQQYTATVTSLSSTVANQASLVIENAKV